jgi:quinol monooxygenase YgiN
MYTCIASFTVLPDTCELTREIIHEEIVPVLRRQLGLVDLMILQSGDEPSRFLVITFWETRDHAEDYHRDVYAPLIGLLKAHLDGEAEVRFFSVDTSTFHHIALGMLAA